MRLTLRGIGSARRKLRNVAKRNPMAAARAVNEIADLTLAHSVELTPWEFGRLAGSAKVNPYAKPGPLRARLTYGTDYALAVHEIPPPPRRSVGGRSARHNPPYGTGGQWKFLETAMNRTSRTFVLDMGRLMRREIQAGLRR